MDRLIQGAVKSVFDRKFDINDVEEISTAFNNGLSVEVGEGVASRDYGDILTKVEGLAEVIGALAGESEAAMGRRKEARRGVGVESRDETSAQASDEAGRARRSTTAASVCPARGSEDQKA